jgi:catechol 2,3-dioxygenase-like lactoylglutathione lyase family enzyme
MRLHHVNVVVPVGETETVARFYADVLGLRRVGKPEPLQANAGAWFDIDDTGAQVHVSERGGERHPDAHFGIVVDDFDSVLSRLSSAGAWWHDQEDVFGGRRGFTRDPAGNRVELLERAGELA